MNNVVMVSDGQPRDSYSVVLCILKACYCIHRYVGFVFALSCSSVSLGSTFLVLKSILSNNNIITQTFIFTYGSLVIFPLFLLMVVIYIFSFFSLGQSNQRFINFNLSFFPNSQLVVLLTFSIVFFWCVSLLPLIFSHGSLDD